MHETTGEASTASSSSSGHSHNNNTTNNVADAVEASLFTLAYGDEEWNTKVKQMIQKTIQKTRHRQFYDIEVKTAPALFGRFAKQQQQLSTTGEEEGEQQPNNDNNNDNNNNQNFISQQPQPPPQCYGWTIRSVHGVERHVSSAAHLANLLLPQLEQECIVRNISRHVRIAPKSNFIGITSLALEQSLIHHGYLPCPHCPLWLSCNKGLWWHLQQQHSTDHPTAVETATYHETRHSTAIVLYSESAKNNRTLESLHKTTTAHGNPSHKQPLWMINNDNENSITVVPDEVSPWDAVKRGSLDELKRILLQRKHVCPTQQQQQPIFDPQKERDHHGSLLLHWAAGSGHLVLVQFLVQDIGCDPMAPQIGHRSFAGRTPLHWAARNGHLPVVDYLLSVRCSKEGNNNNNNNNNATMIDASTDDGTTAFCWAAWQGHQVILERLWQAGCDIQSTNRFGCNAALWAAQGRAVPATLQWLMERGCSVYVTNHSRHGVLHKAAQRGHLELCQWFVEQLMMTRDEDTTFPWELIGPDCDNATPSDLAGMEGHDALAQWLSQMEMTLVIKYASSSHVPDWLTPYSSHVLRSDWVPGGGVLRMRSVYHNKNI